MNHHADPSDFHALGPDTVLDAVDSLDLVQGRCSGRLLALNSYENRVYLIGMDDGSSLVAKFYRPERWVDAAIVEEHQFLQSLADAEVPAVPALTAQGNTLHRFNGFRFALFPKYPGRAPELDQPGVLEWLGRFIGRIHAVGGQCPYQVRPTLNVDTFGHASRQFLLERQFIPPQLLPAYRSISEQVLDQVQQKFDQAGDVHQIRLHGDCHLGNVLWTEVGPHFVDFDDSRMGPAIQDLWMLLSGSRADMTGQLGQLVDGYEQFCDFDPRQLGLIEALRSLRLLHYAAWLAQRWDDPACKAAFPWFNTEHYWQERILELKEQSSLLEEPALRI